MSRDAQTVANTPAQRKPLISHSSILIFSGILIGMIAPRIVSREWQATVYLIGMFGLVAYFGLGLLAERRRRHVVERELEQASAHLEHQFDRHVHRAPASARRIQKAASQNSDRQYLTVTGSNRRPFHH